MDLGIEGIGDASEIAAGASAIVYRAMQESLGREVAVKVLSVTNEDFVRRFQREAQLLAKLSQSPRIVTIHDAGVTRAGQPYLVLLLCDKSLLDEITARNKIDPLEAVGIASKVAAAIDDAHKMGIVHRDLKPANVLMIGTELLVSDFGTSVLTGSSTGVTSSISYTAGYVAPETLMGRAPEKPVDVYALGASLFHMVSGKPPFIADDDIVNVLALASRVATEPVRNLRTEGVPDEVCRLIEAAMAKDSDDRPTITEMKADLDALVAAGSDALVAKAAQIAPPPVRTQPPADSRDAARLAADLAGAAAAPGVHSFQDSNETAVVGGPDALEDWSTASSNPDDDSSVVTDLHNPRPSVSSNSGVNRRRWWVATVAVMVLAVAALGLWVSDWGAFGPSAAAEDPTGPAATSVSESTSPSANEADDGLEEAEEFLAVGQLGEAASVAEQVLEIEPENVQALAVLGEAKLQLGETDEAIRVLTDAANLDSGNARITDALGRAILATAPPEIELVDRVEIGTWPWEMTITDQALWVPISGDRELARVNPADLSDTVRIPVGRLPVETDDFGGNDVWSLVATDRQVVRVDQATNATEVVATLPDCPEAMEAGPSEQMLILLWENCSSGNASIVRLSTATGDTEESSLLDLKDAFSMEFGQELLWISGHNGLTAVSPDSLTVVGRALDGEFLGPLTSDDRFIYVSSFTGSTSIIYRVDQETFEVETLDEVDGLVQFMLPFERLLISVDEEGRMNFTVREMPGFTSTINLDLGTIGTSFGVIDGDTIYIDSGGSGVEREPGYLTAFDLRPGA